VSHPAWALVVVGALTVVIGLVWIAAPSIPWLGKLPGDIAIERENFRFYFPLATCVVLSLLLTGIMWLVK
jgi:hypothetical protein